MTRRFLTLLTLLTIGCGMLMTGCATTDPSAPSDGRNRPQTFLAGAEIAQAKSVAMGSAVSKGWTIVQSSDNRLLVGRPVDTTSAESLVGAPVTSAALEVDTDFLKRQGGVAVLVGAALVANKGTKSEVKVDFTDRYTNELSQSLESLRRSWLENRSRIASATPPLPDKASGSSDNLPSSTGHSSTGGANAGVADTGDWPTDDAAPSRQDAVAAWPEEPSISPTTEPTASEDRLPVAPQPLDAPPAPADWMAGTAAGRDPLAPRPAPVEPRSTPSPAPVESRTTPAQPAASSLTTGTRPTTAANDMLVLNRAAETGIWAYYAEHYAKIRGCAVASSGAVLEEKRPEYEIHRVPCEGGQDFLVRCNAGTCRGLR